MQQIVSINDTIPSGKLLINLLKEFVRKGSFGESPVKENKVVTFFTSDEMEEMEDKFFGKMIEEGRTGKHIHTERFLKKLKSK